MPPVVDMANNQLSGAGFSHFADRCVMASFFWTPSFGPPLGPMEVWKKWETIVPQVYGNHKKVSRPFFGSNRPKNGKIDFFTKIGFLTIQVEIGEVWGFPGWLQRAYGHTCKFSADLVLHGIEKSTFQHFPVNWHFKVLEMALKTFHFVPGLSRTPLLFFLRYLTNIFSNIFSENKTRKPNIQKDARRKMIEIRLFKS